MLYLTIFIYPIGSGAEQCLFCIYMYTCTAPFLHLFPCTPTLPHHSPQQFPILSPTLSHSFPLFPTLSHSPQLSPILSHSLPLFPTLSHSPQQFPILSPTLSPTLSHSFPFFPYSPPLFYTLFNSNPTPP